jgi:hypothetical protein
MRIAKRNNSTLELELYKSKTDFVTGAEIGGAGWNRTAVRLLGQPDQSAFHAPGDRWRFPSRAKRQHRVANLLHNQCQLLR